MNASSAFSIGLRSAKAAGAADAYAARRRTNDQIAGDSRIRHTRRVACFHRHIFGSGREDRADGAAVDVDPRGRVAVLAEELRQTGFNRRHEAAA